MLLYNGWAGVIPHSSGSSSSNYCFRTDHWVCLTAGACNPGPSRTRGRRKEIKLFIMEMSQLWWICSHCLKHSIHTCSEGRIKKKQLEHWAKAAIHCRVNTTCYRIFRFDFGLSCSHIRPFWGCICFTLKPIKRRSIPFLAGYAFLHACMHCKTTGGLYTLQFTHHRLLIKVPRLKKLNI